MSTLVAQTISNGTVSTSSANVIQGSAKAWVNFNGTGTVAIRASYNVSSITDNGTGKYTVNFTNAFSDINYAVTACANAFSDSNNSGLVLIAGNPSSNWAGANIMSTTAVQIACSSSSSTTSFSDVGVICISVFR